MRTLIVSGGHIDDTFALDWINNHSYDKMIAADRGMEFFLRNHLIPDLIVGDFDSGSSETLEYFRSSAVDGQKQTEIVTLNPIKDDTDTESAIRRAIRDGATEITLLGVTGSRLDHVLGNIHLLGIGLEAKGLGMNGIEMEIVDANNRIRMMDRSFEIVKEEQFGKYVSLIPFTDRVTGVTLSGFKYPLDHAILERFNTLGISNEIAGEVAKVEFDEGILLAIESKD